MGTGGRIGKVSMLGNSSNFTNSKEVRKKIMLMPAPPKVHYPEHFLKNHALKKQYHKDIVECLEIQLLARAEPNPLFTKTSGKRLTIVFDLDETLIKSVNDPSKLPEENFDVILKVQDGTAKREMYVSFRPYMTEMLKILRKHCEIIVFTAAQR
jgi:hypothetical protein